jgi:hypothetical protein
MVKVGRECDGTPGARRLQSHEEIPKAVAPANQAVLGADAFRFGTNSLLVIGRCGLAQETSGKVRESCR